MPPADTHRENRWERLQRFLNGIITGAFTLSTGAATGKVLRSNNDKGDAEWGDGAVDANADLAQTVTYSGTLDGATGPGEYLVTVVLNVTTAGTAGTVDLSLAFTDDVGATTPSLFTGFTLAATGRQQATYVARLASGSIGYTATVAGVLGSPVFNLYVHATRLRA